MSSSSENNSTMIRLKTSDGEVFRVEKSIAFQMITIKNMIDDNCAGDVIPLPNVRGRILAKVIEYCEKHAELSEDRQKEEELRAWDAEFVKVDQATLIEIVLAAHYLEHKGLADLACQGVADIINGKTAGEIRSTFNIKNDFTPDEEEKIRGDAAWAFN